MQDYYQLTTIGRGRRLRKMAFEALEHYNLDVKRLRMLTNATNGIFRIDTTDNEKYVLRIADPMGCHDLLEIQSEIMWLTSLSEEPDLNVPQPLMAQDGSWVITVKTEGVPELRHCAVFSWLPGIDLSQRLYPENLYKLGEATAALHRQAETFSPADGFHVRTLDKVFPYSDPGFSYVEPVVIFDDAHIHLFPPSRREVYLQAAERIEATLDELYRDPSGSGIHITHNDLHQWNVKVFRNKIAILDFEDLAWGHPVQDIATTLFYFQGPEENADLIQAYRQGYTSQLSWPEDYPGQIDILIAARGMMLVNYLLCSKNPEDQAYAPGYVARMEGLFKQLVPLE